MKNIVRIVVLNFSAIFLIGLGTACTTLPPAPPDPHPRVLLQTSMGDITLELDREHAPISVDNFLQYLHDGHYENTLIHRVVPGFVIQGGGYDLTDHEKPSRAPIHLEAGNGLSNLRGSVGMARDEAPDSATSEFYINLADNRKLDPHPEIPGREHGYAVFGQVTAGMDVVDRIASVRTGSFGRSIRMRRWKTSWFFMARMLPRPPVP